MAQSREPQPPPDNPSKGLFGRFKLGGRKRSSAHGKVEPASEQEKLIIARLVDMRDMDVREVMTPRVDVVAISIPINAEQVARAIRESGHSCFPVIDGDLDNLVGVLFVNDLFRSGRQPIPGETADPSPLDISRRLRQPYLVPESRRVLDVLSEMRSQRRAFAVVVDEYGGVAGVLTVKDLLEPLVGDLQDEFDRDDEPAVVRVDGNRWLIDGQASVDEVRDRLGIDLPEGEYVTIGGFLFDGFGHIPKEGETLSVWDWELRVVDMDKRRIAKVVAKTNVPPPRDGEVGADAQSRRETDPSVTPKASSTARLG